MSVFQIGVKLIAFQGERMGVVLGRLFDPRSHVKRRGELLLSTEEHGELFFYPRRDRRTSRVYRVFFGQLRGPARTGHTLPPQKEGAEPARTERQRRWAPLPIVRYAQPRLRLQSYTQLISGWHRLTSIVRDPRICWPSLFSTPILRAATSLTARV